MIVSEEISVNCVRTQTSSLKIRVWKAPLPYQQPLESLCECTWRSISTLHFHDSKVAMVDKPSRTEYGNSDYIKQAYSSGAVVFNWISNELSTLQYMDFFQAEKTLSDIVCVKAGFKESSTGNRSMKDLNRLSVMNYAEDIREDVELDEVLRKIHKSVKDKINLCMDAASSAVLKQPYVAAACTADVTVSPCTYTNIDDIMEYMLHILPLAINVSSIRFDSCMLTSSLWEKYDNQIPVKCDGQKRHIKLMFDNCIVSAKCVGNIISTLIICDFHITSIGFGSNVPLCCYEDFDVYVFPWLESHSIVFNVINDFGVNKSVFSELEMLYVLFSKTKNHRKRKVIDESLNVQYGELYKHYMQKYMIIVIMGMLRYGSAGRFMYRLDKAYIIHDGYAKMPHMAGKSWIWECLSTHQLELPEVRSFKEIIFTHGYKKLNGSQMPKNMMIHTTRSDISPDGNWDCEKFTPVKEEIFSFLDTRHNNSNSTLVFKLCNASKPNSRTMYFNSTFTGPTRLTAIMYFNLYDLYDPQYMYDVRPISFVTELVGEKNIRANVEVHIQDCKRIFELFDKEIVLQMQ